jgi:hypothetical protein
MAQFDTSIFMGNKPKSVEDYNAIADEADQRRLALMQGKMQMQNAQQAQREQDSLRALLSGGQFDPNAPDASAKVLGAAPIAGQTYLKSLQDAKKSAADTALSVSHAANFDAEAADKQYGLKLKKANQAITDISALGSSQEAIASLDQHLQAGDIDQQKYAAVKATIPQDPTQFPAWRKNMLMNILDAKTQLELTKPVLGSTNLGGSEQFTTRDPVTGAVTVNSATPRTQTPDSVANNATAIRGQNMTDARAREVNAVAQNTPQYMQTDEGLVMVPKKLGPGEAPTATPVLGPNGQQLSKPLKDIPASVNTAIITNSQNLSKAKQALALLQGKKVGEMTGDSNATGVKGVLPGAILNRWDPSGVDTRAAIADLGSMVLHDRSGAAVTASEYPRLQPFIPSATDDQDTAAKKLKRFIQVFEQENQAMGDTYSKQQGYRPSPLTGGGANATPAAASASPPADQFKGWTITPVK